MRCSKFVDSHLKPYRCTSCEGLRFSSTAALLRHEREVHALHGHDSKPYLCTYEGCERATSGNGFPRRWDLRDHLRRVHNDVQLDPPDNKREAHGMHGPYDKPFLCTHEGCERAVPGNGFSQQSNLGDHIRRVHNDVYSGGFDHRYEARNMQVYDEKPYLCTHKGCERAIPGNGFPREWNLKDHMQRVHNDTNTNPSPGYVKSAAKAKATARRRRLGLRLKTANSVYSRPSC